MSETMETFSFSTSTKEMRIPTYGPNLLVNGGFEKKLKEENWHFNFMKSNRIKSGDAKEGKKYLEIKSDRGWDDYPGTQLRLVYFLPKLKQAKYVNAGRKP